MSIESIRNSGSVYQGSSPVQGTIRESSAVTTEGLQTSADEMQQHRVRIQQKKKKQLPLPRNRLRRRWRASIAAKLIQKQSLASMKEPIVLPLRLWIKRARK